MKNKIRKPAVYRTTGQGLADFRTANNMTREELAVFFNVSMSTISRAERGDNLDKPVSVQLQKILDGVEAGAELELVLQIVAEPKRVKVKRPQRKRA